MTQITLDDGLMSHLERLPMPIEQAVRELVVCELFRRGEISRGRAAVLLGIPYLGFVDLMKKHRIPYFDLTEEEWARETVALEGLWKKSSSSPTPAH